MVWWTCPRSSAVSPRYAKCWRDNATPPLVGRSGHVDEHFPGAVRLLAPHHDVLRLRRLWLPRMVHRGDLVVADFVRTIPRDIDHSRCEGDRGARLRQEAGPRGRDRRFAGRDGLTGREYRRIIGVV